jgi:hypothetical protein
MPTALAYEVGFADSEFLSLHREPGRLTVRLRLWTARVVDLHFSGVVLVVERSAWSVSDARDATDVGSSALADAARREHPNGGPHGLRLFQFLDEDGEPAIEIVTDVTAPTIEVVSKDLLP